MRFFTWNNKRITDADLLVVIDDSEIKDVDALFPEASVCCSHDGNAYYGFIDTERKLFIPMRKLAYAFGGMYGCNLPYGEEVTDLVVDLREYTWQGWAKREEN